MLRKKMLHSYSEKTGILKPGRKASLEQALPILGEPIEPESQISVVN